MNEHDADPAALPDAPLAEPGADPGPGGADPAQAASRDHLVEAGALNRLLMLTPEERKRGVVAASAGNHAQALAYHGGRLGVPVTIVMPEGTPFAKINGTRSHGATELMMPAEVVTVEKLPLLGTGKIDNVAVTKLIKERFAAAPSPAAVVA